MNRQARASNKIAIQQGKVSELEVRRILAGGRVRPVKSPPLLLGAAQGEVLSDVFRDDALAGVGGHGLLEAMGEWDVRHAIGEDLRGNTLDRLSAGAELPGFGDRRGVADANRDRGPRLVPEPTGRSVAALSAGDDAEQAPGPAGLEHSPAAALRSDRAICTCALDLSPLSADTCAALIVVCAARSILRSMAGASDAQVVWMQAGWVCVWKRRRLWMCRPFPNAIRSSQEFRLLGTSRTTRCGLCGGRFAGRDLKHDLYRFPLVKDPEWAA